MKSVLFVCTGNICRSPTAEAVMLKMVAEAGLQQLIHIDSAGTHDYHIGAQPDFRSIYHAELRGYDMKLLIGRQLATADFEQFDYVLVMDQANLRYASAMCPAPQRHKVELFLNFSTYYQGREVPDPYAGHERGFDDVLDMIEDGCEGLLQVLRSQHPA